jgi:hypothetical protein
MIGEGELKLIVFELFSIISIKLNTHIPMERARAFSDLVVISDRCPITISLLINPSLLAWQAMLYILALCCPTTTTTTTTSLAIMSRRPDPGVVDIVSLLCSTPNTTTTTTTILCSLPFSAVLVYLVLVLVLV